MNAGADLGKQLRFFLTDYLPLQRNASPRTILTYRDALKLLLQFVARLRSRSVTELSLADLDRTVVLSFLEDIERTRHNAITTRNHRLAAIRSFFRCVAYQKPESVAHSQQILAIPLKRGESRTIGYLTQEEITTLFAVVQPQTLMARRDDVLLRFLYNTGARIQEALDLRACDLRLEPPPHVRLLGKGRKERVCPLWSDTADRLRAHLAERGIRSTEPASVFVNRAGQPLTRFGAEYILAKYAGHARKLCPSLEKKHVHPHLIRHTTAVHLLQSGVDLNTIRCWLGHASLVTTNRYVEIDLAMKRAAIESVQPPASGGGHSPMIEDALLVWLESL
jgi:site-specific recombinase XerD